MSADKSAVPIACDERVSSLVVLFSHRGARFLTVIAKYVARLIENEPAIILSPSAIVTRDEYANDDPSSSIKVPCEAAPRLLAADVIFRGSAFQPPKTEGPSRVVGLGLHKSGQPLLHKLLYVYGDRAEGVPKNFTRIPIEWQRAFGGPEYELNPVGCGFSVDDGAPNVVDPRNGRHPAGFAPISRRWPLRAKLLGNHLHEAIEGTRLRVPDDVPFSFFQCAPHDQRLRFLAGDEWVVLDGLHPIAQRFQAQLPGLCSFAELHRRSGGPMLAAQMQLDMLSIDGDTLRASVVFRHSFEIDGEVDDFVAVVGVRAPDERAPRFPRAPAFPDSMRPPARAPSLIDTSSIGPATQRAAAERAATPYGDSPPRVGVVADAPGAPWVGPAKPAPPAQAGHRTLRILMADTPPELRDLVPAEAATSSARPPSAPASMRLPPASAPMPGPVPIQPAAAPDLAKPFASAEVAATGIRKLVLDKIAAKEPLAGLALAGADLSGLDLSGASLAGANLSHAKLSGTKLVGAKLAGVKLAGADLRAATLTGADLRGADLSRATLDGADFSDASLCDADLRMASAVGCSFKSARALRVRLVQARCAGALFDGANLTAAEGASVDLSGASLVGVIASDARFSGARADGALLHEAKLDGADLSGVSLRDAAADRVDFSRANLERADLTRARLHGSTFQGVTFDKAILTGVDGRAASFASASMVGVNAEGACFEAADFSGVDLRGARLGGANLQAAKLLGAAARNLLAPGADFRRADLSRASLRFGKLAGANFAAARLIECDLRDADLSGADLAGSDRSKAKLGGAKLDAARGVDEPR